MTRSEFVQRHLAVMERFEDMDHWDEFSPFALERIAVQDEALQRFGEGPHMLAGWAYDVQTGKWYCRVPDLSAYVEALRNAVRLPLSAGFLVAIRDVLMMTEAEVLRRRRLRNTKSDWETADLLAEVQAACGPGRKSGSEWWFRCLWHQDDTPSLHVNPEKRIWKAFCCGKGGGVVAWRKAVVA